MLLRDAVAILEAVAPTHLAEAWDKVGLLLGDDADALRGGMLLTIDLTHAVLDEAKERNCSLIVAYHPPIFEPLPALRAQDPRQGLILRAARENMSLYAPHTALDACPGGITDWLCEGLSADAHKREPGKVLGDCRALAPHAGLSATQEVKIVTFLPGSHADRARDALSSAGAGVMGGYVRCSFSANGTGTFLGNEGTSPAVGKPGTYEHTPEVRLEMVCGKHNLALALETLRRFHPYETPAIDVYQLMAQPMRGVGGGRRLVLDKPVSVRELSRRLKLFLGCQRVEAGADNLDAPVTMVGVVPGAGGSLAATALREGCEVFVTGEMKHHDVLAARAAGLGVVLAGHTPTERAYLPRYAERILGLAPALQVLVSRCDTDPLTVIGA